MYFTSLVAFLCTLSIALLSFLNVGYHTVLQYSSKGRIKDLYKIKNVFLSINLKFLLISPILISPITKTFIFSNADLTFKSPAGQVRHVNSHPPDGVDFMSANALLTLNGRNFIGPKPLGPT